MWLLIDEDTNPILTDDANKEIPSNMICMWWHLVAKFLTYACGATWWPNFVLTQDVCVLHLGARWCGKNFIYLFIFTILYLPILYFYPIPRLISQFTLPYSWYKQDVNPEWLMICWPTKLNQNPISFCRHLRTPCSLPLPKLTVWVTPKPNEIYKISPPLQISPAISPEISPADLPCLEISPALGSPPQISPALRSCCI